MLKTKRLTAATVSLGFLSTTAQVTAIRDLLVAFTGNELTVATTLTLWLFSVAAGCFVFRRFLNLKDPQAVGFLSIIAGIAATFQVVLVRLLDHAIAVPGEIISPGMMVLISTAGVLPCALALGGLFVGLVGLAETYGERAPVARTYGVEALGSAAAGVILSLYLLEKTNAFAVLGIAGMISTITGTALAAEHPLSRRRLVMPLVALALFGCVAWRSGEIDLATRRYQWGGLDVIESVDSRYGSIVVTRRDDTYDFFQSGALAYTVPDPMAAEEAVHIPLLCHPRPGRVLIIGGAGSGVVSEVARHPSVDTLDVVELDPEVLRITGRYAPAGWLESDSIAVNAIRGDGRAYVARTSRKYDVVIINVGMPTSLQINRYYTLEFFRQAARVLNRGGILAFSYPSGGAFMSPALASMTASMVRSAAEVFSNVDVLPGDTIHVLASDDVDLRERSGSIIDTLLRRGLKTAYVNENRIWERLVPLERARMDSVIGKYRDVPENTDSKPVSASFAIQRWARHFASGRLLASLSDRMSVGSFAAVIVLGALVVSAAVILATRSPVMALPGAIMVYGVGVTTMFSQILIVLCFQVVSGYMYGRIAALIAAFMLGLGLGSMISALRDNGRSPRTLVAFQLILAALPLIVVGVFRMFSVGDFMPSWFSESAFIALALLAGGAGGVVFAGASSMISRAHADAADAAAVAYSVDLLGAGGAGFAAGLLAIPALGLSGSAYAVCAANAIMLIVLLTGGRIDRGSLPR